MAKKRLNFGIRIEGRISKDQHKTLLELAASKGISTSCMIRNALDVYIRQNAA